ncbi:MAG: hypothetical protein ABI852_16055 [Gemmatimonadaceae bacterium]
MLPSFSRPLLSRFARTFRIARNAGVVATLALTTLTSACSDSSITAPDVTPKNGLIGDLISTVTGLLIPAKALERDRAIGAMTRTFTVTRANGGRLEMEEAGLRIDVPSGAIAGTSLVITVNVLPGKSVAYDFQPHGTKFLKPLSFRQDLEGTSWDHSGFKGTLNGGYFKDPRQLNLLTGLSLLDELFPIEIKTHEARFDINHFSGYMVSGGRQGSAYYDAGAF